MEKDYPTTYTLPILPLKDVALLPKNLMPLVIGRAASCQAVEYALEHGREIFIVAQKNPSTEHPTKEDLYEVGVRANLLQSVKTPQDNLKILVEGEHRVQVKHIFQQEGIYFAECVEISTQVTRKTEIEGVWRYLTTLYTKYTELSSKPSQNITNDVQGIEAIEVATDAMALQCDISFQERQHLLETTKLKDRLIYLCTLLQRDIDILETEDRVKGHVQKQIDKSQREYYLNEQIKAIHKELGKDDQNAEIARLREAATQVDLPEEVQEKIKRELRRLEHMPSMSAEASVTKNYVEWVIALPWNTQSKDRLSLTQAEKILNKDHAGLEKPKERILEFVAAKKFSPQLKRTPTICLVGPPGVGKTSLAHSVATSLNREFVRISLGGTRDEAEIRGHRRTYIGAMPGKIIQALRKAKTNNPVILLDEIDKLSHDFQGDPSAALLEVLDPAQNHQFVDNFLEVAYDLSQVLFIATANHPDQIPYPLYNRMEIVQLSGYTNAEKATIAQRYLIPKHLKENNLTGHQCRISPQALDVLIKQYSKEAGVRQLERYITRVVRKVIQKFLKNPSLKRITVTPAMCREWLGVPPFKHKAWRTEDHAGFALGLAWTELGGEVLPIETAILPGKGEITLTGQLGEVMRESAQAALSYIRSRSKEFNLKKDFFTNNDIHIHIPEGATPKDGPSAGITLCTALVSAFTGIPTKATVAMSGEITLRGNVLAVGGLKEKILAARQQGITTVLVPDDNKEEVESMKKDFDNLSLYYVENMDQVLGYALEKNPLSHKHKKIRKENK